MQLQPLHSYFSAIRFTSKFKWGLAVGSIHYNTQIHKSHIQHTITYTQIHIPQKITPLKTNKAKKNNSAHKGTQTEVHITNKEQLRGF
jgi:hypothetical protein